MERGEKSLVNSSLKVGRVTYVTCHCAGNTVILSKVIVLVQESVGARQDFKDVIVRSVLLYQAANMAPVVKHLSANVLEDGEEFFVKNVRESLLRCSNSVA